jgi:ankyrin repeat protein
MPRLHDACEEGLLSWAEKYINENDDMNEKDEYWTLTPLMYASMKGHIDVVKLLVNRGVDIDIQGGLTDKSALMFAVCFKRNDIVQLLVRRGANLELRSKDKNTALVLATLSGNIEASEFLIAAGASVEAPGLKKWSALRWAEKTGKEDWGSCLGITPQTSETVLKVLVTKF